MAVSIDTVYQRVLALANKEQRGYITPQEFNLFANQAQMEIFEQYFYDIKEFNRAPGNNQEYSDPLSVLYEKIGKFEVLHGNSWMAANMPNVGGGYMQMSQEIYKIGTVKVSNNQAELLNTKDWDAVRHSPLTRPTEDRPIATITSKGLIVAIGKSNYATPITTGISMSISFIKRPAKVQWAYVIVNDKALYNDNIAVNFELHPSEETELVYKILKLSGINIKAAEVVQVAQTLEQTQVQQEKQ